MEPGPALPRMLPPSESQVAETLIGVALVISVD